MGSAMGDEERGNRSTAPKMDATGLSCRSSEINYEYHSIALCKTLSAIPPKIVEQALDGKWQGCRFY